QSGSAVRRVRQIGGDERKIELRIPAVLAEIVLVEVVEHAVLAAADQVASLRNDEHAGRAEILILVLPTEVAESTPEVRDDELRLAVVDTRDAGGITQPDETLAEVAGHRARIHAVAGREIDIVSVDTRSRA